MVAGLIENVEIVDLLDSTCHYQFSDARTRRNNAFGAVLQDQIIFGGGQRQLPG